MSAATGTAISAFAMGAENGAGASVPLAVDLDGTLVRTDLLVEMIIALIKQSPLHFLVLPFWLLRGKAHFKRQVSRRVALDPGAFPYRSELLAHLRNDRAHGRRLVLATANDESVARQVADHLQLFDAVLASDGVVNLSGRRKRDRLVKEFGRRGFDYAGDGRRDLAVWAEARRALVVDPTGRLGRAAARVAQVETVFRTSKRPWKSWIRALRPHQWSKNLLLLVPLMLAHRFLETGLVSRIGLAFLSFSLCASAVYLLNDLTDLQADRQHPQKRRRPLASGDLPVVWGLVSVPLLLGLALLTGMPLPPLFLGMLIVYFALNLAYSFYLKRIALLDVIVLAGLYTMRIMAGSAAVGIWPSPWLLGFSTFMSLSLALVKRYSELIIMSGIDGERTRVRGYELIDKELLASFGSGSGYLSVLVMAMYIASGEAEIHYSRHQLIWLICPLLLYWISYFWLMAHRGEMNDDPLVFSARDRVSRTVILLMAVVFLLAM